MRISIIICRSFLYIFVLSLTSTAAIHLASAAEFDHSHSDWNQILNKYVKSNTQPAQSEVNVGYAKLVKSSDQLNKYLKEVSKIRNKDYQQFTAQQRMALLLNAHNAFLLKIILDFYPIKSLEQIGKGSSSARRMRFIRFLQRDYSLEEFEKNLIKKELTDVNGVFAIHQASLCPPLQQEAYVAEKLDVQLKSQASAFFNIHRCFNVDHEKKQIFISSFLDQHSSFLTAHDMNILKLISQHLTEDFSQFAVLSTPEELLLNDASPIKK